METPGHREFKLGENVSLFLFNNILCHAERRFSGAKHLVAGRRDPRLVQHTGSKRHHTQPQRSQRERVLEPFLKGLCVFCGKK